MSPSPPFRRQDEIKDNDALQMEALQEGITVEDLRKRRVPLGLPGEKLLSTADPDAVDEGKVTDRQKRVKRQHVGNYCFRVFVENHCAYDVEWQTPQTIIRREHERYQLQGYTQHRDYEAWDRHDDVRDQMAEAGGPAKPKGSKPSSAASSRVEATPTPPPTPRERSRSPRRRDRELATTSKAMPPLPSGSGGEQRRQLKRAREVIAVSSDTQPENPPRPSAKKRRPFRARPSTRPPSSSDESTPSV